MSLARNGGFVAPDNCAERSGNDARDADFVRAGRSMLRPYEVRREQDIATGSWFGDEEYAVEVVGHYDIVVNEYIGVMVGNLEPALFGKHSKSVQKDRLAIHSAEKESFIRCADCDVVGAFLGVVVALEPD